MVGYYRERRTHHEDDEDSIYNPVLTADGAHVKGDLSHLADDTSGSGLPRADDTNSFGGLSATEEAHPEVLRPLSKGIAFNVRYRRLGVRFPIDQKATLRLDDFGMSLVTKTKLIPKVNNRTTIPWARIVSARRRPKKVRTVRVETGDSSDSQRYDLECQSEIETSDIETWIRVGQEHLSKVR